MSRLIFVLLFTVASCAAQFAPTPCFTITGPCASEDTSWLIKAEAIAHTVKLAAMLADALKNTVRQGGLPGNNLQSELANISQVLQAGQALNQATQNLPAQWKGTWTLPPTIPASGHNGTGGFHGEFTKWSAAAQDSIRVSMYAGQMSHIQQQSIVGVISQIEGILSVVDGRLKAQQATATAAARTAASLEKMHSTMLSQGAAAMTYNQYRLQQDMAAEQAAYNYYNYVPPVSDHMVAPPVPVIQ